MPERDSESATPRWPRKEDDVSTAASDPRDTVEAEATTDSEEDGIVITSEFVPGDVLADRYRIVRFIARGGMGEVYEVEDLTLLGTLALKTIRPEIARDRIAVERFKREINIARRITHPNVSRIYDVGVHHGSAETMFLTMEFLPGETLTDRIRKRGRLTTEEAQPFAEQVCAGLAAAHDAGIIHRDFKSPNVMLVTHGNVTRAIVTDFGLARSSTSDAGMATISDAGAIMGTPAYMAPEQVEGKRLTPAADIYALGIVLYEMLTARRPFHADTPLSSAIKRLTEPPVPPSKYVPDIDPVWESVILRCLARDPERRLQSASEVAAALRQREVLRPLTGELGLPTIAPDEISTLVLHPLPGAGAEGAAVVPGRTAFHSAPTVIQLRTRRRAIVGAFAITVAVVAAVSLPLWRKDDVSSAGANVGATKPVVALRRAVAVLGLRSNSAAAGDAWIGDAIAEMLTTELGTGGKVRVASADQVARLKADQSLTDPYAITAAQLRSTQGALGVDSVVTGSFTVIGKDDLRLLRLDLRLLDAASGSVLATSGASGTETQLFDLVSRASGALRQQLGLANLSPSEIVEVSAALPKDREAVRLYTEGLARLRRLEFSAARVALEQAGKAAEHPLIYSALSSSYSALGEEKRARDAATRAVALGGNLSRELKLIIEARLQESASQWEKAAESYRTLRDAFPDNVEYGLDLANAELRSGRTNEALVTVAQLRKLPQRVADDPRIDLLEARIHQELGDSAKHRALAAAATVKARRSGSRSLVAQGRLLEATAELNLGNLAAMSRAIDEARSLFRATGNRSGVARALELTAQSVHQQGDLNGERRLLDQALALHREIGDRSSTARVMMNIGTLLIAQGRPADAEAFFDDAIATFRATGAKYGQALALNNIGAMMFNRGDLAAARKRYRAGLDVYTEIGDRFGKAMTLTNLGEALEASGSLDDARTMHEEALAINREIGLKAGSGYDLQRLAEIHVARGELAAAKQKLDEAMRLQQESGDILGAAESRMSLQVLAIEQGRATEAERNLREIEEILRTQGAGERSSYARALIADALLAQGKQREAIGEAETAWKQVASSDDLRVRFKVAVSRARAIAASKQPDDVRRSIMFLEQVIAEASRASFVGAALEARLAAGEIENAAGMAAGRKRLSAVATDARGRGYERVARRAGTAAG